MAEHESRSSFGCDKSAALVRNCNAPRPTPPRPLSIPTCSARLRGPSHPPLERRADLIFAGWLSLGEREARARVGPSICCNRAREAEKGKKKKKQGFY